MMSAQSKLLTDAVQNLSLTNDIETLTALLDRQQELEAAIFTLAHDLRNPLATSLLLTDVLEEKLLGDEDARRKLDALRASTKQMTEQIHRMLSLYGITQRKLEAQRIDLTKMATAIAEDLLFKSSRRRIEFQIAPGLVTFADPVLLQVALENLLGNAVKYTEKKEFAIVEMTEAGVKGKHTIFCVRDNGDGFDSHQAEKLFRPLVRLHKDHEFPGTGLGLASVARIIRMHGGTVHAEGKKSAGAAFYFDLPQATS